MTGVCLSFVRPCKNAAVVLVRDNRCEGGGGSDLLLRANNEFEPLSVFVDEIRKQSGALSALFRRALRFYCAMGLDSTTD
jgi:hypothetical protein